jgi:hypothetical protein
VLAGLYAERKIGVALDRADPVAIKPDAKCGIAQFAGGLLEDFAYIDQGLSGFDFCTGMAWHLFYVEVRLIRAARPLGSNLCCAVLGEHWSCEKN